MNVLPSPNTLPPTVNCEPGRPNWFRRNFPSLSFYWGMSHVVIHAAHVIRKGRSDMGVFCEASWNIAQVVDSIGARVSVENIEVLQRIGGPCIVAGNHMSSLETMLLPGLIMPYVPMTFVAKDSLLHYPYLGTVLSASRPITVARKDAREDLRIMTTQTHEHIARGVSVVVFPQTTRTTRFSPTHFNSIGAKLAKREKVPLVPFALKTDLWGYGKWIKDLGKIDPRLDVRVRFGEPIDASDDKEAHRRTLEFVGSTLREWGAGEQ
jgi:1-acyl-sn-glycerol-3-phosphate acyltransferase